jgi:hypothetical protein
MEELIIAIPTGIILQSEALHPLALLASCLCLMGIVKKYKPTAEAEEN